MVYLLLTKRSVKMAGYWRSSFFFCVFINRDEVEVNKNKFIKWPKRELSLAVPTREISIKQDEPFLPTLVANQKTGFAPVGPPNITQQLSTVV